MTGAIALNLKTLNVPLTSKQPRRPASLRLELAWVDLQLWIAVVFFSATMLLMVLMAESQSQWQAVALGLESAFCLLLLAVRVHWRRRIRRQWESDMQTLIVRGNWT